MNNEDLKMLSKTQLNMFSTMTPTSYVQKNQVGISRSSKYRYSNFNERNPETAHIASSISKEYRKQIITPLPEIRKQKSFMLEQWLNDTLEGVQNTRKAPLSTLKKYQMDKGNLRNANLNNQQINTLYNGLFVYTSGIKSAFQSMFASASLQNREDKKMEKAYWQMFIKLLQNTIPVKTCFQISEDQYKRQIMELRRSFKAQQQKQAAIQEQHEEALKRIRKELEESDKKLKDFMKEFKVMHLNLQLYEQTFNEQVNLRLKFQEKINQVYSSYEELKDKYEGLKIELKYKNQCLLEISSKKSQFESRVSDQIVKNEDLLKRLLMAQLKLKEREGEIIIKNQEITDIKIENNSVQDMKRAEETALEQLLLTIKLLKKNQSEQIKNIEDLKRVIAEKQVASIKMKQTLADVRQKNDEIYLKYHQQTLKSVKVQELNMKQAFLIQSLKKQLGYSTNKLSSTEIQRRQLLQKTQSMNIDLELKNKEIQDKNKMNEKHAENLQSMKTIKDKYERLNQILRVQNNNFKEELSKKVKELSAEKEKCFDLKFEIDKYSKENQRLIAKDIRNSETIKSREEQLSTTILQSKVEIEAKDLSIAEKQYAIVEKNKDCIKLVSQLQKKEGEKLKKFQEITYLTKQNKFLEKDLNDKKEKINALSIQLQAKNNQILLLTKNIQGKDYAIQRKKRDIDNEIVNLKIILSTCRKQLYDKTEFVHPMIVEDLKQQIYRLHHKIEIIHEKDKLVRDSFDSIKEQLQSNQQELKKNQIDLEKQILISKELMKENSKIKNEQKRVIDVKLLEKDEEIKRMKSLYMEREAENMHALDEVRENLIKSKKANQMLINQAKLVQKMTVDALKRVHKESQTQIQSFVYIATNQQQQEKIQVNIPGPKSRSSKRVNSTIKSQKLSQKDEKQVNKKYQIIQNRNSKIEESCHPLRDMSKQEKTIEKSMSIIPHQDQDDTSHHNFKNQIRKERKIGDEEFKKALKLTYIRK